VKQETQPLYPVDSLRESAERAERAILERWKTRDIFRKTVDGRRDAPPFVFYEGPPTANGKPGVHHVLARAIKDLVCRYQTMRGRYVRRRGGWDTHGLPVELEVEKQLDIDKREIVERIGIEAFNRKCRESVFTYLDEWRELTERIAFWIDLEDEYVTLENEYIESVWALLARIHEKNLLYRGFKSVPYSTKSGTTLSDHEVALGYREVDDPSVTIRFRWADDPDVSFLVWTTTPWTLPGNTGLAVHPDVTYVKVRHGGEVLVLAEDLVGAVITGERRRLTPPRSPSCRGTSSRRPTAPESCTRPRRSGPKTSRRPRSTASRSCSTSTMRGASRARWRTSPDCGSRTRTLRSRRTCRNAAFSTNPRPTATRIPTTGGARIP
jgi:isoleucyl-tRNA synthetase